MQLTNICQNQPDSKVPKLHQYYDFSHVCPRHICIPNQMAVLYISISSILPQGTKFTIQLKGITLLFLSEQYLEEE